MAVRLSPERRSWNMSRIRGADTAPERKLRSLLHRAGFRFRLHSTALPGRPDIVLSKFRTAVFLHGCYWHRHRDCANATTPKTRTEFWQAKFQATVDRDRRTAAALRRAGWRVIIVWECDLARNPDATVRKLVRQLTGGECAEA